MTSLIKKVVYKALSENLDINDIEELYLKRDNEYPEFKGISKEVTLSNPSYHISKQIAMVYKSKKLSGITGSNTHISMFAKHSAITNFKSRGDYLQGDRNQCICDLIRSFNEF